MSNSDNTLVAADEAKSRTFAEGLDIHSATAAKVFAIPLEDVSDAQYRTALTINFDLLYGVGVKF